MCLTDRRISTSLEYHISHSVQPALAILGSAIAALSFVPYLKETAQKKTRPRIASWITWLLITGISTAAALSGHAYPSALLTGAATVIELLVVIFAIRNGDLGYGWLDGISQAISLTGIVFWIVSKNPALSLAAGLLADFCAAIPTYHHGWTKPHEESGASFMIFSLGSLLTLFGVARFSFIDLAFPVYFTVLGASIGAVVLLRQKTAPPR